jgi:aryl-alcohol dehydrogenase-like predicted oxidoreductase
MNVQIPGTSLSVSRVCLGTGEIGTKIAGTDAFRLLDAFIDGGGNFIDTAHNYGDWVKDAPRSASEKAIGEWLKSRGLRDKVIIGTKGAHWHLDKPEIPRLDRVEIERDLNESLTALQLEQIDLYWLHRDDPDRPVEDILETLNEQVNVGKIRYFGASNWRTERIRAAQEYAREHQLIAFVADQVLWNAAVLARAPYGDPTVGIMDTERFQFHQETGMAAIVFQSQAFGLFHRMENGTLDKMNPGFRSFYKHEESLQRYQRMRIIQERTGWTIGQVVLGYLVSQSFLTIPIVGCQTVEQVNDSLSALNVHLTPDDVRFIEEGLS